VLGEFRQLVFVEQILGQQKLDKPFLRRGHGSSMSTAHAYTFLSATPAAYRLTGNTAVPGATPADKQPQMKTMTKNAKSPFNTSPLLGQRRARPHLHRTRRAGV
jgi:hypothetical protein